MFWYSAMGIFLLLACGSVPDRQVEPPAPPLRPAMGPEGPGDDDADGAPEHRGERQEQAEAMDAERADGVADRVAEEGVLVLGGLHVLARGGVDGREHQRAVQRQG